MFRKDIEYILKVLAFKCVFLYFCNKSDDYLYLYIKNLKYPYLATITIRICVDRYRILNKYRSLRFLMCKTYLPFFLL